MADFPPNLDDGELWIPSDIFPEEVPSKFTRPRYPSELAYMEDLAQRFAALAFLEHRRNQIVAKPNPNPERFAPPVRYDSIGSLPAGYLSFNGGFGVGHGHGLRGFGVEGLLMGSRPAYYPQHFLNPVQPQVESFMETRATVLQREQNRILQNRVLENRILPLQGSGLGMRGGGFVREYGGTGVFLPRTAATTTPTIPTKITTTATDDRRRQSVRNRKEIKVIPHRNPMKMDVVGKQEDCHYQLPSDMGLPQDWTY